MENKQRQVFRQGVLTVAAEASSRLVDFVAARITAMPIPPLLDALELIELGAVYVNAQRSLNAICSVQVGDEVRIHTEPRRFPAPGDLAARIIAENEDSLLIDKPSGIPTEPTTDNLKENLLFFLEELRGQKLFLPQRLSQESEGLLLVAKNPVAMNRIRRKFAEGQIIRRYAGHVETPVATGEQRGFTVLSCEERRGDTNLLTEGRHTWRVDGPPLSLCYRLEIEFRTPRPKKIREALAASGAAIIGDSAYGSRVPLVNAINRKSAMAFLALSLCEAQA